MARSIRSAAHEADRPPEGPAARLLPAGALEALIAALRDRGYSVFGPVARNGVVDLGEIRQADDLPAGWREVQEAGRYRLVETGTDEPFAFTNGATSWKRLLHPPERRVWHVEDTADGPRVQADSSAPDRPAAFLGVRACDLAAISTLDTVLAEDAAYRAYRANMLVVAVECGHAGATCFCASMGTGPEAAAGFDLALTEIAHGKGRLAFLARPGSAAGADLLEALPGRPARARHLAAARAAVERARGEMGRSLDTRGLKERIAAAAESPHWDDVAARCLTCANCTMVCPTCYCTGFRDAADLDGSHAERWRHWDSCFTLDFTFAMGGPVRRSAAARYRQWLTHKLSTWVDQFGEFGCVGCGRCITWCPVGIDITAEAAALVAGGEADPSRAAQPAQRSR